MFRKLLFEVDRLEGEPETPMLREEIRSRITGDLIPFIAKSLAEDEVMTTTAFRFLGRTRYETEYVVLTRGQWSTIRHKLQALKQFMPDGVSALEIDKVIAMIEAEPPR